MKWDQAQIVLRKPQTSHDHSPTMGRLSHVCDQFQSRSCQRYTDWISDWSEASSGLLGLITDFLRKQWAIFVEAWD